MYEILFKFIYPSGKENNLHQTNHRCVCVCVALSSGIHKALIKKTALNLRLTLFSPASSTLETIRINFMVTVASFYRRKFVSLNFKFSQNSLTVFVEEPRMSFGGGGERFPDIFEGFFLLLL